MELVQADLIRWLLNLRPFHSVSALTAVEGFIAADGTVSNVLSFIESLHPCIGPAIHAPVLTDVLHIFKQAWCSTSTACQGRGWQGAGRCVESGK